MGAFWDAVDFVLGISLKRHQDAVEKTDRLTHAEFRKGNRMPGDGEHT